jgi:hypothetical protein
VRRANKFLREQPESNFRVGDYPFPIVWQPLIGLETADGALLRCAGEESQIAEAVTVVFPQGRFGGSKIEGHSSDLATIHPERPGGGAVGR